MRKVTLKVCLLGEGAVGKTSLIHKFVYDQYDDKYIKTIGTKVTKKVLNFPDHDTQVVLMIYDILGQMVSEELQASYMRGSQGALLVCDLTDHKTFDNLDNWISLLQRVPGKIPVILLGNKCDLKDQREISEDELEHLAASLGGMSVLTSAKTGENVEDVFRSLSQNMTGLEDNTVIQGEPAASKPEPEKIPVQQNSPDQNNRIPLIPPEIFAKIQLPPKEKKKAEKHVHKLKKILDKELRDERITADEYGELVEKKKIELGLMPPMRRAPLPPVEVVQDPPMQGITEPIVSEPVTEEAQVDEIMDSPASEKPGRERKTSAFFNVPVEAIGQLRERLEIILADRDKEIVEGILVEYGFDCGSTAIKSIGIICQKDELEKTLPDIWIGIGLSKVSIVGIKDEVIHLSLYELEIDEPHFLGGCLAGVVSGLVGSKYKIELNEIEEGYTILLKPGLNARSEPEEKPLEEKILTGEIFALECGSSYIIPEKELGFSVFREKIDHNWKGMCLTREYPPKLREQYGLHNTPIFWLTDAESDTEQVVKPSRLSFEMRREIMDFMNENQKGIILIHGLEYLISHLNFLGVLKWLQSLRDQAAITGTTLLVAVNPVSIEKQNFQNLILEFEPLTGKDDEIP